MKLEDEDGCSVVCPSQMKLSCVAFLQTVWFLVSFNIE